MLKYILKSIRVVFLVNLFSVGLLLLTVAASENRHHHHAAALAFVPLMTWCAAALVFVKKADALDDRDLGAAILVSLTLTSLFALLKALQMPAGSEAPYGAVLLFMAAVIFYFFPGDRYLSRSTGSKSIEVPALPGVIDLY